MENKGGFWLLKKPKAAQSKKKNRFIADQCNNCGKWFLIHNRCAFFDLLVQKAKKDYYLLKLLYSAQKALQNYLNCPAEKGPKIVISPTVYLWQRQKGKIIPGAQI